MIKPSETEPNLLPSQQLEKLEELARDILTGDTHLSYSSFSRFTDSPSKFAQYKLDGKKDPTPSMIEGRIFHTLTLEPENFDAEYAVERDDLESPGSNNQKKFMGLVMDEGKSYEAAYLASYSTKTQKEKDAAAANGEELYRKLLPWYKYMESIEGKQLITKTTRDHCKRLSEAVLSEQAAGRLIREALESSNEPMGGTEVEANWEHLGFKWHGYLDGHRPKRFILDLKKCPDASPRRVRNSIDYEGWGMQGGLYSLAVPEGMDLPYFIIAADNDYQVTVMEVSKHKRIEKIKAMNWYLDNLRRCLLSPEKFLESFGFYTHGGIYKY